MYRYTSILKIKLKHISLLCICQHFFYHKIYDILVLLDISPLLLLGEFINKEESFMSFDEKQDIYMPLSVRLVLENDAELFEVLKKDTPSRVMQINLNYFINIAIKQYYSTYKNEQENYNKRLLDIFKNLNIDETTSKQAIQDINTLFKTSYTKEKKKKEKKLERTFFKATEKVDTKSILADIYNESKINNYSISGYLCNLLTSYSQKPIYERERIIFKQTYERLLECCKNKHSITFLNSINGEVKTVIPYEICVSKEGMFNYLLCYEYNDMSETGFNIYTYRINRINISSDNEHNNILTQQQQKTLTNIFNSMKKHNVAYFMNKKEEDKTCVKLSKAGISSFKQIYFGRPKPYKIVPIPDSTDYRYYFNCSQYQLYLYFRRFNAGEAFVEYPKELQDKIRIFHEKSLETYKSGILSND